MSALLAFSISPVSFASAMKLDEAWEQFSAPEIMSYFFIHEFNALPLSGKVSPSKKLWSGDYWALNKGNINYRWYAKKKIGFNLISPSRDRARTMTIPELAELSPSEKYDLFTGRYDYPLKQEVNRISDPQADTWEGICHGWSPASMNHNEPKPKLLRNSDGIEIPFGSSDIKALISYYYAYSYRATDTHQMGRRCFRGSPNYEEKDCVNDLNAGAFHLVLANRMGLDGKTFIGDLERFQQVWNHPFTSYQSQITGQSGAKNYSAFGTAKVIQVRTTLNYVDENGHDWQPVIDTPKQEYKSITYDYELDIDSSGKIIGGEWRSKLRPDFLWLVSRPRQFEGSLSRLGELLDDE
jgi:hypothetical protein